jgi:hypothetical protein
MRGWRERIDKVQQNDEKFMFIKENISGREGADPLFFHFFDFTIIIEQFAWQLEITIIFFSKVLQS